MKTDPNPQGKGLVPVLDGLASSRPKKAIPPKHVDQIAGELFTSMFVLESEFAFKPVVGNIYYLYRKEGLFRLSLVSPEERVGEQFGQYIGECTLEADITWTLVMDEIAAQDKGLIRFIQSRKDNFEQVLESADRLEDVLPVFCESFPFYRRLFASALAHSLGVSMELSGIRTLTYGEAKGLLEHQQQ
jgi:hypothetical protein